MFYNSKISTLVVFSLFGLSGKYFPFKCIMYNVELHAAYIMHKHVSLGYNLSQFIGCLPPGCKS